MASSATAPPRQLPPALYVAAALVIAALVAGALYLSRPGPHATMSGPSQEAKAYLPNLHLSDVQMKAAENFMQRQVVYLNGKITNSGTRDIHEIDVFCIFNGVDGREVHRERSAVTKAGTGLESGQTRAFQLTFDSLPDGWNQAMPRLVIAQIDFAP